MNDQWARMNKKRAQNLSEQKRNGYARGPTQSPSEKLNQKSEARKPLKQDRSLWKKEKKEKKKKLRNVSKLIAMARADRWDITWLTAKQTLVHLLL